LQWAKYAPRSRRGKGRLLTCDACRLCRKKLIDPTDWGQRWRREGGQSLVKEEALTGPGLKSQRKQITTKRSDSVATAWFCSKMQPCDRGAAPLPIYTISSSKSAAHFHPPFSPLLAQYMIPHPRHGSHSRRPRGICLSSAMSMSMSSSTSSSTQESDQPPTLARSTPDKMESAFAPYPPPRSARALLAVLAPFWLSPRSP